MKHALEVVHAQQRGLRRVSKHTHSSSAHVSVLLVCLSLHRPPDGAQNGYYKWEPTEKAYIKSAQAAAGAWRVPNVYDLVSA